jgi:FdrA protein
MLSPLYSNVPIHESQNLSDPLVSQAHTVLDLGEDVFTVGRLHPMMDNDLRLRRLRQEAADPDVALILLDVVLGEGAHPDPAGELAPAIAEIKKEHGIEVVAILVGTDEDPQDIEAQREQLVKAGAEVFEDTVEAVIYVGQQLGAAAMDDITPVPLDHLTTPLAVINVGVETFFESVTAQDAQAVHVDWRPPAGGNEELMAILAKMRK